ncbi:hypothetical protein GCM10010468_46950 [Actinocorallia longicatena]|uniref:Uncharacterized protein n=1 Tax=Actinocorallia longicatena TaxID=111803 RepID=A0ABP6QED7_9ACTN
MADGGGRPRARPAALRRRGRTRTGRADPERKAPIPVLLSLASYGASRRPSGSSARSRRPTTGSTDGSCGRGRPLTWLRTGATPVPPSVEDAERWKATYPVVRDGFIDQL